jgi:hypothetical protein
MKLKSPLIYYADIGLVATLVRTTEEGTEPGYVNIEYKPLNDFKTHKLPFPVHIDHITYLKTQKKHITGVEDEIMFIHTGENGSLVEGVLNNKYQKTIQELREKIRSLQLQVSSAKQTTEDAMSGAEAYVARAKSITSNVSRTTPFHQRFGNGPEYDGNEYDF